MEPVTLLWAAPSHAVSAEATFAQQKHHISLQLARREISASAREGFALVRLTTVRAYYSQSAPSIRCAKRNEIKGAVVGAVGIEPTNPTRVKGVLQTSLNWASEPIAKSPHQSQRRASRLRE